MDGVRGSGRYVSQASAYHEYSYESWKYQSGVWTYWYLRWGMQDNQYYNTQTCYQNAYPHVMNEANTQTPEEEYTSTQPFYLTH
jgi:hypothetical protein